MPKSRRSNSWIHTRMLGRGADGVLRDLGHLRDDHALVLVRMTFDKMNLHRRRGFLRGCFDGAQDASAPPGPRTRHSDGQTRAAGASCMMGLRSWAAHHAAAMTRLEMSRAGCRASAGALGEQRKGRTCHGVAEGQRVMVDADQEVHDRMTGSSATSVILAHIRRFIGRTPRRYGWRPRPWRRFDGDGGDGLATHRQVVVAVEARLGFGLQRVTHGGGGPSRRRAAGGRQVGHVECSWRRSLPSVWPA